MSQSQESRVHVEGDGFSVTVTVDVETSEGLGHDKTMAVRETIREAVRRTQKAWS